MGYSRAPRQRQGGERPRGGLDRPRPCFSWQLVQLGDEASPIGERAAGTGDVLVGRIKEAGDRIYCRCTIVAPASNLTPGLAASAACEPIVGGCPRPAHRDASCLGGCRERERGVGGARESA